ncbi:MAG: O-antigen ligase family protein [Pseudomonadota bacterium]
MSSPLAEPIVAEPIDQDRVAANSWLGRVAAMVLFLTLALGLVIPKLAGAGFLLLSLLGLIWLESALRGQRMRLAGHEKLFFLTVLMFVLIWLLAWWVHGLHPVGADDVGRILRLLLIVPLYLFLRRIDGLERSWWVGLTAGALIAGLYALWFSLAGEPGEWQGRVGGPTNPIYFGGVVLAFGLMLLPRIADDSLAVPWRVLVALAVVLALLASALSGSRGAWLALPPLLILYILTLGSRQSPWIRFGVPIGLLLLALVISLLPNVPLGDRFGDAVAAFSALVRGDEPSGTLGIRWVLWSISVPEILQHWWFGGGPGAFQTALEHAIADGRADPALIEYEHPHNQYLSALLIAGLPGLVSLLWLLGMPLGRFIRLWQTGLQRTRLLGWCGLTVIVVLATMALTESIFQRNNGIVWFSLLTAASMGLVQGRRYQELFSQSVEHVRSLSVIMICKNEADRIGNALESVAGWADEIIVLDSGSDDATVDICRRYTDRVIETDWPGYGIQKQRALDLASGDWVLSIDADEVVSDELRREIELMLARSDPHFDGYTLPWSNRAFGYTLQFGHWARASLRLIRRGKAAYTDAKVHEKLLMHSPRSRIGRLEGPLYHDSYRSLAQAKEKLDQYARLQAEARARQGRTSTHFGAMVRAVINGLDNYVLRLAVLDGRGGWIMTRLHAHYTYNKYRYLAEHNASSRADGSGH